MVDLPDIAKTELAIVERTNVFRMEQGLGPLRRNPALDRAARSFAQYLAKSGRFAHEADGRTPAERTRASGYGYCNVAENLALNLRSRGFTVEQLAHDTMEGWKASPGHRRNLMLTGVTEIGVGIARAPTGDPKFLSVQLLARPDSLSYAFTITNKATRPVAYTFAGKDRDIAPRTMVTYKACEPGKLTFKRAGSGWFGSQRLSAEFTVAGTSAFVIQDGADGTIAISEGKTPARR
jgi:hypothetical protein